LKSFKFVSFLGVFKENLQLLTISSYEVTFAREEVQANAGIWRLKHYLFTLSSEIW
jgi:hypothetical protein